MVFREVIYLSLKKKKIYTKRMITNTDMQTLKTPVDGYYLWYPTSRK